MTKIQVLDHATIDKIAAGEVVERPASVVKELVENAIDAGASAITVEIKDGGISFIRVTDNGTGIAADQVRSAFLRHATSKIRTSDDLHHIHSLGFRGEALSSIAAVAQVEMMTKPKEQLLGVHFCVEDGREVSFSEVGVPEGTTILVKHLFYHVPARKKFLKSAVTEGGYIADLCEHLAMSKPHISLRFIVNGKLKFQTSGNGDVKEIVYRIYGKDYMKQLLPVTVQMDGMTIEGFIGKPALTRSNRAYETCFINGRYIKSNAISVAIEEGYRSYLMQHKFPFVVLYLSMDTERIDVNVHPTKMDIRITDSEQYFKFLTQTISQTLHDSELIPNMEQLDALISAKNDKNAEAIPLKTPEPFEQKRLEQSQVKESIPYQYNKPVQAFIQQEENAFGNIFPSTQKSHMDFSVPIFEKTKQLDLFEEKILKKENKPHFKILGQVFDTYWLISYEDKLLFVDQHAAHEKVKYEALIKELKQGQVITQQLQPPLVIHLTGKEEATLTEYQEYFEKLGFVWEDFGSHSIAMREMPMELYRKSEKQFLEEILDELEENGCKGTPDVITERIASMACKAAVKGNQAMNFAQMNALLEQLLELENPYHCPHGRSTMIFMTKQELEKKFKRIV